MVFCELDDDTMSPAAALGSAYIIAARRTVLGRPGGLHKARRIESLTTPVLEAALADAKLEVGAVDEIFLGNTMAGGNPARLVGLAAGLRESAPALTVDRQCASGLDAILLGLRSVALGEADVVVAGGVESVSTAPWRIAKPKSLFQTPRFIGPEPSGAEADDEASPAIAASEDLARRLGISRGEQDMHALRSHLKAEKAQGNRRFVGEIVPLRLTGEEARDEGAGMPEMDDLAALEPLMPPDGTLTSGNSSALRDGAAIVVIVSARMYAELGSPPALRLIASTTQGVGAGEEANASIVALKKLMLPNGTGRPSKLDIVETSESSAAQALALARAFELDDDALNPDGGAVARGHALAASSAVSVVRLFTSMVRPANGHRPQYGAVTQGALGGLGVAALFEAV